MPWVIHTLFITIYQLRHNPGHNLVLSVVLLGAASSSHVECTVLRVIIYRHTNNNIHKFNAQLNEIKRIIPLDIFSKTKNRFLKWAVTKGMLSLLVTSNMDICRQQRAAIAIEFLRHKEIKQLEIVETLQKVHRDKALSQLTGCQWLYNFK